MKAYVLHDVNDLRMEEVSMPEPGCGEVLVKVLAVGVCGSDIPRIYETGAHVKPLIPGHEFSGMVVKAGNDVDKSWVGKSVGVFPLIPCGKCGPCMDKKYEMCRDYNYIGSRCNGALAQYVVVPEKNLVELPENVAYEIAAMLEPMAVAAHAIRKAQPSVDDSVVVCGLGTIGLITVMLLKNMGIKKILVIGNKDLQKTKASDLGIPWEDFCDTRVENATDWIMAHTDNAGADVFFECIGKNETINMAADMAAPGGKIILVGNPYTDVSFEKAVYWKILRNQLTIMGSWNSTFTHDEDDDWHYILKLLADAAIRPGKIISHSLNFDRLEEGLKIMRDKSCDYVKVMASLE